MQPLAQNRSTALHLAGKYGHENVFKLLVELGADVNAEDLVRLSGASYTRTPTFALTHETFYGRVRFNVQYGNTPVLNPIPGQMINMTYL
jgi:ankyrin repeat protein